MRKHRTKRLRCWINRRCINRGVWAVNSTRRPPFAHRTSTKWYRMAAKPANTIVSSNCLKIWSDARCHARWWRRMRQKCPRRLPPARRHRHHSAASRQRSQPKPVNIPMQRQSIANRAATLTQSQTISYSRHPKCNAHRPPRICCAATIICWWTVRPHRLPR